MCNVWALHNFIILYTATSSMTGSRNHLNTSYPPCTLAMSGAAAMYRISQTNLAVGII